VNVNAEIKSLCQQIVDNFQPEKVVLFGSYADGTPTEDSDIDLLVVMPFIGNNSQKAIEIRTKIKTKMPLDLLVRTSEQVKQRIEMEDFFMRDVISNGKILYETNNK
jgi:uncharacterized protein